MRACVRLRTMAAILALGFVDPCAGGDPSGDAAKGYRTLRTVPYLPADFDQEVFDNLWKVWPEPLRSEAEKANPDERRTMAFSRYGLVEPPDAVGAPGMALGYVRKGESGWVMNCLSCHGGKVAGKAMAGAPNSHFLLETLTEEVRLTKLTMKKPLTHMDLAQLNMPLGTTAGTTNSVMFGVALGALRDRDMNVDRKRPVPKMVHHDMDPPPLWNVGLKKSLYMDGFAPKNHRVIMQFMMLPTNSGATMRGWENDYRDILAWIESLEPPKYPHAIDRPLAERGNALFEKNCSRCHGTYGSKIAYPELTVAIDEIGTDPVRWRSLTREYRAEMADSWMSFYGKDPVVAEPKGYVAPPLRGVWASGPYFHNGSVPTLWHVLNPAKRPTVWRRTAEDGFDPSRVGLVIEEFDERPESARAPAERRHYFDTRLPGKSAQGHDYPSELTDDEKTAVLEYLKTL